MYIEKNEITIINLEKEIKVFGSKGGFELWQSMAETKNNAKHIKEHGSNYGIWIGAHPNEYYFVGTEVTSFENQSSEYSTYIIPSGKYIQIYFNAENIEQLLGEKCGNKYKEGGEWAAKNSVQIDSSLYVEVYPEGMFDMKYPEMYYWCYIKE
jgi:effector-binding domain-containing protein